MYTIIYTINHTALYYTVYTSIPGLQCSKKYILHYHGGPINRGPMSWGTTELTSHRHATILNLVCLHFRDCCWHADLIHTLLSLIFWIVSVDTPLRCRYSKNLDSDPSCDSIPWTVMDVCVGRVVDLPHARITYVAARKFNCGKRKFNLRQEYLTCGQKN